MCFARRMMLECPRKKYAALRSGMDLLEVNISTCAQSLFVKKDRKEDNAEDLT